MLNFEEKFYWKHPIHVHYVMAIFLTPRLEQAMELAIRVHGKMKRKGDDQPYLVHPMSVLALLVKWGADEDTCIAGLLHDVIEDAESDTRRAEYRTEITEKFGKKVLEIVEGVTEQDKSLPWRTRKERYLEHLQGASKNSLLISCADRTHNCFSLLAALEREKGAVWKRFNAPKEEQMWFLNQVLTILTKKLDIQFTSELCMYVNKISIKAGLHVSTLQFNYYDAWKEADLTCPICGWKGRIKHEDTETYSDLFDYSCPTCEKMLAIVSFPTREEIEEAARKGNTDAKKELRAQKMIDALRTAKEDSL